MTQVRTLVCLIPHTPSVRPSGQRTAASRRRRSPATSSCAAGRCRGTSGPSTSCSPRRRRVRRAPPPHDDRGSRGRSPIASCARSSKPFVIDKRDITIHASVGIALGGEDISVAEELLRNADVAMYDAKRAGSAASSPTSPDAHARVRERQGVRLRVERAVGAASSASTTSRSSASVDAHPSPSRRWHAGTAPAMAWSGPEPSSRSPDELLFLDRDRACGHPQASARQARSWGSFRTRAHLPVNVNLAPSGLQNPELARGGPRDPRRHRARPSSGSRSRSRRAASCAQNPEVALQTMRELRELGVALGLDDIGTGHSSLAYLREFPLDSLKIGVAVRPGASGRRAGRGVRGGDLAPRDVARARCRGRGDRVRGPVLGSIAALGCTHAQGFYFGEPLAGSGISSYLWAPTLPAQTGLSLVEVA